MLTYCHDRVVFNYLSSNQQFQPTISWRVKGLSGSHFVFWGGETEEERKRGEGEGGGGKSQSQNPPLPSPSPLFRSSQSLSAKNTKWRPETFLYPHPVRLPATVHRLTNQKLAT